MKVEVTAQAERGAANRAVEELLAGALGVAAGEVRVTSGHTSRSKSVEVAGCSPAEAVRRLATSSR